MTYAEVAEILETSIREYECDDNGKPNGNITCDLTQEVLDIAVEACRMREDLIEQMKELIRNLEV